MTGDTFTCTRCGLVQNFEFIFFWSCFSFAVETRGYYCTSGACGRASMFKKQITEWEVIDAERAERTKEDFPCAS